MNDTDQDPFTIDDYTAPTQPTASDTSPEPGRKTARATIVGALVVGGIAGAAILGPLSVAAAAPSPTTTARPAATPATGTTGTTPDNDGDHAGGPGPGGFGHSEAVTDTSVVAKAIGITEAQLNTALAAGQTVADVAKAHNVPLQTVIDALVADGTSELDTEVAQGTITQAQADAQKAEVLQRATAQANGTFVGGPGGPGDHAGGPGPGGFGHDEAVSDASVVAKAIGITEAQLNTALASGQTVAQVAKAHNVPLQAVIDALVADGTSELATEVANGTITQAQADAQKAEVLQRATAQANGSFAGGHP